MSQFKMKQDETLPLSEINLKMATKQVCFIREMNLILPHYSL